MCYNDHQYSNYLYCVISYLFPGSHTYLQSVKRSLL